MKYGISEAAYMMVISACMDYDRKRVALQRRSFRSERTREYYFRVNDAVDRALIAVCRGESAEVREMLRQDIARRVGFARAQSKKYYLSERVYKERKRRAVIQIAEYLDS